MKRYRNLSGNAGILAYESGPDFIRIRFVREHETYTYSSRDVGLKHVAEMKRLAMSGRGLTTYINQHPEVKLGYARD